MAATNFKFLNFKTEEKPLGLKEYQKSPFLFAKKGGTLCSMCRMALCRRHLNHF